MLVSEMDFDLLEPRIANLHRFIHMQKCNTGKNNVLTGLCVVPSLCVRENCIGKHDTILYNPILTSICVIVYSLLEL